jgi:DNA-binding NarL/FixJ family response regulator
MPLPRRAPVTVLLTRFEDLLARGLRAYVDDDPSLHVAAADVAHDQLAGAIAAHAPQVAILDLGSLGSALELHALARRYPTTRLLVLAARPTARESNQLIAFGATACLSREAPAREVLNAIHLASRGLHVIPRLGADAEPDPPGPELLTAREADVLELLQQGHSNAEIALTLHVGVETVRTHARHIYRKLGVRGRRDLASLGR